MVGTKFGVDKGMDEKTKEICANLGISAKGNLGVKKNSDGMGGSKRASGPDVTDEEEDRVERAEAVKTARDAWLKAGKSAADFDA